VTVLNVDDGQIPDSTWLAAKKSQMLHDDDVFNEEFFKHIILSRASRLSHGASRKENLEDGSNTTIHSVSTGVPLKNGPYFAIGSGLFQVFKLYDDPQDAFMFGVQVDEDQPDR
jgi:hypothetical protein